MRISSRSGTADLGAGVAAGNVGPRRQTRSPGNPPSTGSAGPWEPRETRDSRCQDAMKPGIHGVPRPAEPGQTEFATALARTAVRPFPARAAQGPGAAAGASRRRDAGKRHPWRGPGGPSGAPWPRLRPARSSALTTCAPETADHVPVPPRRNRRRRRPEARSAVRPVDHPRPAARRARPVRRTRQRCA